MRARVILFALAMVFVVASAAELRGTQICEGCPVKKLKTTRLRDGKWQTNVALGAGVTVQDAELIVRAARRNIINDMHPEGEKWPAIDAQKLTEINNSEWIVAIVDPPWSVVRQPGARYFDVVDRSGRINVVAVINGRLDRVASITVDP